MAHVSHPVVRQGRRAALVVVVVLVLSGCFQATAIHMQQTDPTQRPWWCHSELMADEPGAQWYLDHGISKGDLSWDDCITNSGYFDKALKFAMQWPTRGQAEAAGWSANANYAAGMGTHHARGNPLQGAFDPTTPNFLQYDGNGPDAKLVGMSWYVNNGPDGPPAGFPGDNDWWHRHEYLCLSSITGLIIFDGRCPAGVSGSTIYLGNMWLLHVWIVPGWEHRADVFVGHHPCLLPDGPAAPDDQCWTSDMHM
jgi:hypothetical protein